MNGRGLKINSIAYKILTIISDYISIGTAFYRKAYEITGVSYTGRHSYISKRIYDLKKRGYIQEVKEKDKKRIYLTNKGHLEIIKYKIKLKREKTKWDEKWRAISWDVPERSRKDRDYLRRKLSWLGFKELQKSFWIFPYNIEGEVRELIDLYKKELSGDVRLLLIEKIENDSDLKKYFNLV